MVKGAAFADAKTLVSYAGFIPQTNEYNDFLQPAKSA
jgi:hypothetical protein